MLKSNKILRLKGQRGRVLQVVREHYVREDVPCYSSLCLAGCDNTQGESRVGLLPKNVTHYLVPDCRVTKDYLEILELPEFIGLIFMHTVQHSVQHEGSRRLLRRLQNLLHDPRKESILFHNEFQKYAYHAREPGESMAQWQIRNIYEAANWYYNHLAGQLPVVMVTLDQEVVKEYGSQNLGVYVITLQQYLQNFWPDLTAAQDLYESLAATLQSTQDVKDREYQGYLPADVLETGIKTGCYVQGTLQVNKHSAQNEAFVRPTGASKKEGSSSADVLVVGVPSRNRAIHGDTVVVELLPRSQWRGRSLALQQNEHEIKDDACESNSVMPTGRVVGVLQRNWRDYVACFAENEESQTKMGKVLVVPFDWRVPKIRISTRQVDALRNCRILVRIDSWEVNSQYPNGHFVRSLGTMGELETEISTILMEHGIQAPPFTEAQLKEMPVNSDEHPWQMDAAEISKRRDLRDSHLVFSIDPKGCEDVDDTLSVRLLPNGNLELGVHIADVTHFVRPGMQTDLEARSRGTTVYLADRRYDMLPTILSADLCSLLSQVDRYAMSVIWELNDAYEVQKVWYGRTVIRSAYKLFYEIAQAMADGANQETLVDNIPELQQHTGQELTDRLNELKWAVLKLMETARHLRARGTLGGALELEGVEVQVKINDTKNIEDLIPKQSMEIHETIAECMIFANHWVAKKICSAFPSQALLRHHPMPRQEDFENLTRCATAKGFSVRTTSNKALADSLDSCVDDRDPHVNKILRSLATQAMSNAAYFSTGSLRQDQYQHYGLALDYYTHFTSPIRRYADVLVHRQLMAALGEGSSSQLLANKDLQALAEHINRKHRESQNAQRDSLELYQTLFFKSRPAEDDCCIVDGVVFQLRANGILVLVPRYGLKGAVYLRNKDGLVAYVQNGQAEWSAGSLTGTDHSIIVNAILGSQQYRLFDHITVRICVQASHAHSSAIKLQLVKNAPHRPPLGEEEDGVHGQKAALIKEVQVSARERGIQDVVSLGADFQKWKSQYGQTESAQSFYSLLLSLTDAAMLDV